MKLYIAILYVIVAFGYVTSLSMFEKMGVSKLLIDIIFIPYMFMYVFVLAVIYEFIKKNA